VVNFLVVFSKLIFFKFPQIIIVVKTQLLLYKVSKPTGIKVG